MKKEKDIRKRYSKPCATLKNMHLYNCMLVGSGLSGTGTPITPGGELARERDSFGLNFANQGNCSNDIEWDF